MRFKRRLLAAGIHLVSSLIIAGAVAIVGLGLMYPGVYSQLAGGTELFFLICGVDVTLGPFLTGVVFADGKSARALRRDIAIIVVLQLAALCYGLYVLAVARPVALVFEVDRFRVISQVDVRTSELPNAPSGYQSFPWTGPWLLGTRAATNDEKLDAIEKALEGHDIGARPSFWRPYDEVRHAALARAYPAEMLLKQSGGLRAAIERDLTSSGLTTETARFLPVQSRQTGWVVWLDASGMPKLFRRYERLV